MVRDSALKGRVNEAFSRKNLRGSFLKHLLNPITQKFLSFVFFILLISVTFLLISNSQSRIAIAIDLAQSNPISGNPVRPDSDTLRDNVILSSNGSEIANNSNYGDGTSPISDNDSGGSENGAAPVEDDDQVVGMQWELCKGSVSVDYIPCLDNWNVIKKLPSRRHMEHREKHCPDPPPRCLVPFPEGYQVPVPWPKSRDIVRSYFLWW